MHLALSWPGCCSEQGWLAPARKRFLVLYEKNISWRHALALITLNKPYVTEIIRNLSVTVYVCLFPFVFIYEIEFDIKIYFTFSFCKCIRTIQNKSTGQLNSSFTRLNLSTTIHPFLDLPDLAVVLLLDIGLEDFHPVVELDLVEMQVQVLDRHISRCCKIVILCKKKWPEAETPNNFCTSRFSQVCPDFSFLQNANLYSVSGFTAQICLVDEKI